MKKIISTLVVAVILFNFIFCNSGYATENVEFKDDVTTDSISGKDLEGLISESKANYVDSETKVDFSSLGTGIFGTIGGILARFFNIFPQLIRLIMLLCVVEEFTIQKAVFNEISIFNIDYFNFKEPYEYTIGNKIGDNNYKKKIKSGNTVEISIRKSVAKYYYILRLIAMALSLVILIYVGIRMALSTISSDKAKYKGMLIAWIESIVLLFAMQYIISFIISAGKLFGDLMYSLRCIMDASGELSFETEILAMMDVGLLQYTGWSYVGYSIAFWFLIYVQTKFFLMYFKRVITVGFLILISPIITITYPIDKVGDGKAQGFTIWSHELILNVLIQPIQALIYLVFMYTAGEIAKISMWVALAFLLGLTKFEKIILQLFNLRNVVSLKPVDEQRKK